MICIDCSFSGYSEQGRPFCNKCKLHLDTFVSKPDWCPLKEMEVSIANKKMYEYILEYLYEINARCDYKLEEVAEDICTMVRNDLSTWSASCMENGMFREAEYLEYVSKVI
jgi:hypothetical protein